MAKTYTEIKKIIQPLYQRYRSVFRGPRDSHNENLEMNKILIDMHRLDENILNIDNRIYDEQRILIGQQDPEKPTIHEEYEDGKYYIFSDVQFEYYGDSSTPDYLRIDTMDTAASKMNKLSKKIKMLEQRRLNG
jgi:hypothetical protein